MPLKVPRSQQKGLPAVMGQAALYIIFIKTLNEAISFGIMLSAEA